MADTIKQRVTKPLRGKIKNVPFSSWVGFTIKTLSVTQVRVIYFPTVIYRGNGGSGEIPQRSSLSKLEMMPSTMLLRQSRIISRRGFES